MLVGKHGISWNRGGWNGNGPERGIRNGIHPERAERERDRNGGNPERGLRNGLPERGNPERVPPERDLVKGSLFRPERASTIPERGLPEE